MPTLSHRASKSANKEQTGQRGKFTGLWFERLIATCQLMDNKGRKRDISKHQDFKLFRMTYVANFTDNRHPLEYNYNA